MRSDTKLRDTIKPIRTTSNVQTQMKNNIPSPTHAYNQKMSPFQTPAKAIKVFSSEQKTQQKHSESFIQYSHQDHNHETQDHDQTVLSFLRTMDAQNVQILKQSLRQGEKFTTQQDIKVDLNSAGNGESYQKKPNSQDFMKNLETQIINQLVQKIQNMPAEQYTQLLIVLDEIEKGKHNDYYLLKLYNQKPEAEYSFQPKIHKIKQENSFTKLRIDQQNLMVRILSNHGHSNCVGLTELQIYDIHDIGSTLSPSTISRVLDGHNFTISDEHMWFGQYNKFPVDINIKVGADYVIGSIKLWNYNKNLVQLNTGIKSVEIFINDIKSWSGDIRKGSGSMYDDYSQTIVLPKTSIISTDRKIITPQKPSNFAAKQSTMNYTQNSYQSQQTKKSEESNGVNRETFISNTSNNMSKISQCRSYKHPKVACNLFDEQSSLQHKTPLNKQPKDQEHFKVFSESNLMQRPIKQMSQRTLLIKFPNEQKPPQPLLNNLFPSRHAQIQMPKEDLLQKKPVKVLYRRNIQ